MIVDAHCHVWTWKIISDNYWNELAEVAIDFFERNNLGSPTRDEVKNMVMDPMMDPDGSKLIANMDTSGVDKTIILPVDWGYGIGEAEKTFYGSLGKEYPDRIIAFAGVDPMRPDAVDILDRAVNDYGCRGLKYHPASGFYPDCEESYRVLEKAQDFGLPVLSHTGPISKPLKSKYAQPVYLDTVVSDFPRLKIIAAHLGFCWWHELMNLMASKATTFYADFSGQQIKANRDFGGFCWMLREAIDEAGASKILWGTDNPPLEAVIPMKDWLNMIRNLPDNAPDGIEFTKQEIDALLGENAVQIFGLSG